MHEAIPKTTSKAQTQRHTQNAHAANKIEAMDDKIITICGLLPLVAALVDVEVAPAAAPVEEPVDCSPMLYRALVPCHQKETTKTRRVHKLVKFE